jgi:hypothetical protein
MPRFKLDDDVDDFDEEDEDIDPDDEESDEDEDEDEDEEKDGPEDDVETWQVGAKMPLKITLRLTFGDRPA